MKLHYISWIFNFYLFFYILLRITLLHIIFSYRFSLSLWFIKDCTYVPFLWSLSSFCLVVIFRFICIMAYNFYFYGISLFVNKYVFSCLSVSCSFPWICFVLFRYAKFCLICYILLYYYPFDACLFFDESQNGMDPDGRGSGENWEL